MKSKKAKDDLKFTSDKSSITRREFLKSSMLLTAGITLAACSDASVNPVDDFADLQSPKNIVIVGAGMAGLVAGYELTKAGFGVTVLEANNRVGGRVFTIREPFSDGLFAEAGAARIPPDHNHTLHYVELFGLTLDSFYPRSGNYLDYFGGNRTQVSSNNFLNDKPWPGSVNHSEYVKIRGGTDKLSQAFAEYLSDKIHLNSPVEYIKQNSDEVVVRTLNGNEFNADRALVTVPLTVLNKIEFNPSLSPEKIEASNGGFSYAASTRVFVQFKERFWEAERLNGWARTDWPEEIWQQTFDQPGNKGVLLSYLRRSRAEQLDILSESERKDHVLSRWNSIFPGAQNNVEQGFSYSWVENEWSGGAWASPSEEQLERVGEHIGTPEGRIHFAGEHISGHYGWMQGALASGLRVTQEITKAEVAV